MSESLNRWAEPSRLTVSYGRTDGLTENRGENQPSLTSGDARAHIRAIGLPVDESERHERTVFETRTPLPEVIRKAVLARDWYRCTWCGTNNSVMHVDHIVPWSAGGTNETTNLRTLCEEHNLDRSNYVTDTNAVRVLPIVYGCFGCWTKPDPWATEDFEPEPVEYGPRGPVWCFKCWRPGVAELTVIEATLRRQRLMPPDAADRKAGPE